MNPGAVKELLLCSLAFNYAVIAIGFTEFILTYYWMYRLHSRWFILLTEPLS